MDLWCLDISGEGPGGHPAALSADERRRAARFRFRGDRARWIAGRQGLRAVLARYLDETPDAIEFVYGRHGKPRLRGLRPGIAFSLSHCEGLAIVAVTGGGPIGADLERVRPIPDAPALTSRFFACAERDAVLAGSAGGLFDRFFACWTRKEAVIKATGRGLSFGLDRFAVSVPPDDPPRVRWMADDPSAAAWRLAHVEPKTGFVGALAVRAPVPITVVTREPGADRRPVPAGSAW